MLNFPQGSREMHRKSVLSPLPGPTPSPPSKEVAAALQYSNNILIQTVEDLAEQYKLMYTDYAARLDAAERRNGNRALIQATLDAQEVLKELTDRLTRISQERDEWRQKCCKLLDDKQAAASTISDLERQIMAMKEAAEERERARVDKGVQTLFMLTSMEPLFLLKQQSSTVVSAAEPTQDELEFASVQPMLDVLKDLRAAGSYPVSPSKAPSESRKVAQSEYRIGQLAESTIVRSKRLLDHIDERILFETGQGSTMAVHR